MDLAFVIINAITVAAIYGLIAIAVSITWSSLGLINLAYGFIFSFAGDAAWLVATQVSKNPLLIAGTGIVGGAVAGLVVCLLVFIPLHDKPAFTSRGMKESCADEEACPRRRAGGLVMVLRRLRDIGSPRWDLPSGHRTRDFPSRYNRP